MKKITKRIMALLLAMTMLLTALPVSAYDVGNESFSVHVPEGTQGYTLSTNKAWNKQQFAIASGTKRFTATSSNRSVATVSKEKLPVPLDNNEVIYLTIKKPGTTTITTRVNNKTIRTKVRVFKYVNPVQYVRVGSTIVPGSKYNKPNTPYTLSYRKYANKKTKLGVRLKKGWKFEFGGIDYAQNGWRKTKSIKNGSSIKIQGGPGFGLLVSVINTKTKQREVLQLVKLK